MTIATMVLVAAAAVAAAGADFSPVEYKLVATNKLSTSQREINQWAADGFRFAHFMGGNTSGGGNELVSIMTRERGGDEIKMEYRLLATQKTSTMQKEMNAAGEEGFRYRGQSVFDSAFGGNQVVVMMERPVGSKGLFEYKLQATNRTSTMQRELSDLGAAGYQIRGVSVGMTAFGGEEVVSILERERK